MNIIKRNMKQNHESIINAAVYFGMFNQTVEIDDLGGIKKIGNPVASIKGVQVELFYQQPELKLRIADRVRSAMIIRPVEIDDSQIRGAASTLLGLATRFVNEYIKENF